MNINFEFILTMLVVVSGIFYLADVTFLAKRRKQASGGADAKAPLLIDYSRSFFPVLLLVLIIRSFCFEAFRIPSGSLEPTLDIGDFILVNKYHYGLRLPVLHTKFVKNDEPQRGDIVVFRWPPNPSFDYIKRVIGVPGDHIQYKNKVLYVNGVKAAQQFEKDTVDSDAEGSVWPVVQRKENLQGVEHAIFVRNAVPARDFDVTVPKGNYFMMGDNRDDSSDSRFWGFLPEENIVGKAVAVIVSWDSNKFGFRWQRFAQKIS